MITRIQIILRKIDMRGAEGSQNVTRECLDYIQKKKEENLRIDGLFRFNCLLDIQITQSNQTQSVLLVCSTFTPIK